MKTFVPFKQFRNALVLLATLIGASKILQAQSELVFKNGSYVNHSGVSGQGSDSSTYKFSNVASNIDALVKINGRSSSLVTLSNIDVSNTGFDKAFQPQIEYNNGSVNGSKSWWMEFKITFVDHNTTTPVVLNSFNATALDIDGDNNRLHEWVSFFSPNSYTLENPTKLTVSNLLQSVLGLLTTVGKTFDGVTADHSGVDTSATDIMTTAKYNNVSSFIYRIGASTTGSSNSTERNYSLYFKSFTYASPIVTLPVKLESFTATLIKDKTELKWTTSSEMNVSHFVIEKSLDGRNFSEAGIVFAYGNTSEKKNYSFPDNVSNVQQGVIFYRLRSVDNDGKSELSETRLIRISKTGETLKMVAYPNPASNELRLTLPANWQGKEVIIEVFNQEGRRVKMQRTAGSGQTETIIVSELPRGFYLVKASSGQEIAQEKMIKN